VYLRENMKQMSTILNSESKPPSVDYILSRISDENTIALFYSIANSDGYRSVTLRKSNLTEKKYYARISGLMDAGLIKRRKGEYSLTLLGKVVYNSQMIIGKALTYYGKLKAIEEIEMSYGATFPKEELAQLINALIDSDQIKDAIMKPISVGSNGEDVKMPLVKKKPN
jgi:predicted transcriptional regulator